MVVASRKRGEEGRSGQGGTFQHLTYLDSPQLLMRLKEKKKRMLMMLLKPVLPTLIFEIKKIICN